MISLKIPYVFIFYIVVVVVVLVVEVVIVMYLPLLFRDLTRLNKEFGVGKST